MYISRIHTKYIHSLGFWESWGDDDSLLLSYQLHIPHNSENRFNQKRRTTHSIRSWELETWGSSQKKKLLEPVKLESWNLYPRTFSLLSVLTKKKHFFSFPSATISTFSPQSYSCGTYKGKKFIPTAAK